MWSTDQGFAVAQTIITGTATGISDGSTEALSSNIKESIKYTILSNNNSNKISTHRIHQIRSIQYLGNYKILCYLDFFILQLFQQINNKFPIHNAIVIPSVLVLRYQIPIPSTLHKNHFLAKIHNLVVLVCTSYLNLL